MVGPGLGVLGVERSCRSRDAGAVLGRKIVWLCEGSSILGDVSIFINSFFYFLFVGASIAAGY